MSEEMYAYGINGGPAEPEKKRNWREEWDERMDWKIGETTSMTFIPCVNDWYPKMNWVSELLAEVERQDGVIKVLQMEKNNFKRYRKMARKKLNELNDEIIELNARGIKQAQELLDAEKEVDELNAIHDWDAVQPRTLVELRKENDRLRVQNEGLRISIRDMEKGMSDQKEAIEKMQRNHQTSREEMTSDHEAEIARLRAELESRNAQFDQADKERTELKARVKELEKALNADFCPHCGADMTGMESDHFCERCKQRVSVPVPGKVS